MAVPNYNVHNFRSQAVLYASQMNAIDQQVKELTDAVQRLQYEPITIVASVSPRTALKGATVNSLQFTIITSRPPVTVSIDGIQQQIRPNQTMFTINIAGSYTESKTFGISAVDENDHVVTAAGVSLQFYNNIYYGVAENPENITSEFITGLSSSELSGKKERIITVEADDNDYIWYAVPDSLGECTFSVNGFAGGFDDIGTFTVANSNNYEETYHLYRSTNPGLGETKVIVT